MNNNTLAYNESIDISSGDFGELYISQNLLFSLFIHIDTAKYRIYKQVDGEFVAFKDTFENSFFVGGLTEDSPEVYAIRGVASNKSYIFSNYATVTVNPM